MALKRNLIANFAGQGWVALVSLAFVPVYIDRLGVEAYGLIGLYVVLQTWLSLLDLGMTPTLTREAARVSSGAHTPESIGDLVRSLEIVVFVLAAVIVLGIWCGSGAIASRWVRPLALSQEAVAGAVAVIAFVVAARFCEGIYRGALFGFERQVFYNGVYALISTFRYAGAAVLVIFVPSIVVFFWWQAGFSLLTVLLLARAAHAALPTASRRPRFSIEALRRVGFFAGGMSLTALFALLFSQGDKIMLSRLVDLESFGIYMLAVALAGIFPMLAGPVASAYFPRLTAAVAAGDRAAERDLFRAGVQIVALLAAPAVAICMLAGREIVIAWTGTPALANSITPILGFVAIGAFCNAVLQIPFMLQLAHGWTTLSVRINLLGAALLLPAVYLGTRVNGVVGAAIAWASMNVLVLVLATIVMHRRLLPEQLLFFAAKGVAIPLAASSLAAGAVIISSGSTDHERFVSLFIVVLAGLCALIGAGLTLDVGRRWLKHLVRQTLLPGLRPKNNGVTI